MSINTLNDAKNFSSATFKFFFDRQTDTVKYRNDYLALKNHQVELGLMQSAFRSVSSSYTRPCN